MDFLCGRSAGCINGLINDGEQQNLKLPCCRRLPGELCKMRSPSRRFVVTGITAFELLVRQLYQARFEP